MTERQREAVGRAVEAWQSLFPGAPHPDRVDVLKRPRRRGKSVVLSLGPVGPGGMDVVAKELIDDASLIERTVYRLVLPHLSVDGPELLGWVESGAPERVWLFLEAVGGEIYDKSDPHHLSTASRWLATLHAETFERSMPASLSRRKAGYYESLLPEAVAGLEEVSHNEALSHPDRRVLRAIRERMQTLQAVWPALAGMYGSIPVVMAHGDFKSENMGFAPNGTRSELRVFDWSEAHLGPLAVDLWPVDIPTYHDTLAENGFSVGMETISAWQALGVLLRQISSVVWEIPKLRFDSVESPMRKMSIYEQRLGRAMGFLGFGHDRRSSVDQVT